MTVEPAGTREEEVVCRFGVQSDGRREEYLKTPLCVRVVTMSPVPVCAKVSLQSECKKYLCAGERLSHDMWHVLDFAGMFS